MARKKTVTFTDLLQEIRKEIWAVQLLFKSGRWVLPRPPTPPYVRVSYTAVHVSLIHRLRSNQCASIWSDFTFSPLYSNHWLEKACSTALVWESAHRFRFENTAFPAIPPGTPSFVSFLYRLRLLFCWATSRARNLRRMCASIFFSCAGYWVIL